MKRTPTVSIVIPVYNEQSHIRQCLEAIDRQTSQPLEVIVVDNNSSDGTLKIVQDFPFVQVLHETKQGVIHARNLGFNKAKGDIIARIDADTLVAIDWIAKIQDIFQDSSYDAVSGSITYYDMALKKVLNVIDAQLRRHHARALNNQVFLYGANMAVRRSVWLAVRQNVCLRSGIHEDLDLAIHLNIQGFIVKYVASMTVAISTRRADTDFLSFWYYTRKNQDTYSYHDIDIKRHTYPMIFIAVLGYLPLRILHRGYDMQTDSFSLARVLTLSTTARIDPTFSD